MVKKAKEEVKEVKEEVAGNGKSAKEIMKEINKRLGYSAVSFGSSLKPRTHLPFPQARLNNLLGGGVPRGLFSCFWGGKSSAKSSTMLGLIRKTQEDGGVVVYCDLEHSFDGVWAQKMGVKLDGESFIYGDFSMAEDPLDLIIEFCNAHAADLIIIDSIHGLSPKNELTEGKSEKQRSVSDDSMALIARKLSQFFRMAAGVVSRSNTAVVLIGQTRMDLGAFIKLETLSGGHALLHWCSVIVQQRRGQKADAPTMKVMDPDTNKKVEVIIGFDTVYKVTKSKVTGCWEDSELHLPFYKTRGLQNDPIPEDQLTEADRGFIAEAEDAE